MRIDIKNISIRYRIYFVISVFLVSAFFSILILDHYRQALYDRNESLKLAITTQQTLGDLSENSKDIFNKNIFDLREDLTDQQEDIEAELNGLVNGGRLGNTNKTINKVQGMAAESGLSLLNEWRQVTELIKPLHNLNVKIDSSYMEEMVIQVNDSTTHITSVDKAVLVNNPELATAVTELNKSINAMDDHYKTFIYDLNIQSDSIYDNFKYSFFVIGLINLIIFTPAFFWLRRTVITPLKQVGRLAKKVSEGDIDTKLDYNKKDEIGDISSAISSLATYLNNASSFVHNIGEGNLESQFEGVDEDNITEGSLAHSLVSMKHKLKNVASEDSKRNWTTEGLAQFAEILRKNNSNLNELGDAVLAALVPYTKSNQGCMYVAEDVDENFKLYSIAYYAFDSKKFMDSTVDLGEGLVGQTFLEKKTTHLLEIPEEYMAIKSGLGGMKPTAILVVPLSVNEESYGILELSTLNIYEDYQIEFVEKLAETIASTIANVKNNEKTKSLLEDSQQLTEQMRSQEEEMRQNMEELSATQEEMARKEAHTTATVRALESSMLTAELDMKGVFTGANSSMLTASKSGSLNQLIGLSAKEVFKDETGIDLPGAFWKELNNGESKKGIFRIGNLTVAGTFIPSKVNSEDYQNILIFCQQFDSNTKLQQVDDQRIVDLEEELMVNLESLQIAEEALKKRLANLE